MLTPDQTTFRRLQTDSPGSVTMYFSVDAADAMGRVIDGPWHAITLELTPEEQIFSAGLVARFRQTFCDQINQTQDRTP